MNTATATALLATHTANVRNAIAARDAVELTGGAEWRAAHKLAGAACSARDAAVKALSEMSWDGGACEMEMCLYGRLLRRHADPVKTTWADLR